MKKSLTPKFFCALLSGIVVYGVLLATPVQARTPEHRINLTTQGASIAAGNANCKGQPYFRYVGGKPDLFSGPDDPAYPSPNLVNYMNNQGGGIVDYDVPVHNGRFGDSFNLQNTRSVCYAVIQFRMRDNGFGDATNDALHIGHVENNGTFTTVAQVLFLGTPPQTPGVLHTYAFTPNGRNLLSLITGRDNPSTNTPLDSVLDIYLQDDTEIDFIMLWVWYGPNCSEVNPAAC